MNFSNILTNWYQNNKRDLPWRNTKTPYKIWLSEIILQQTRVAQGLPYYEKFLDSFPRIQDLANADNSLVMKLWQGLGYYSRARNLHFTAQKIANENSGKFPTNYADLKKLKGIGEYTAAAIASFCFNENVPVVDGNVYRVLSRIYGIETPIDSTEGKKEFKALATQLIEQNSPAEHNQAIMEFGALQCTPKSPNCEICPFLENCSAARTNRIKELPNKSKKVKVEKVQFHYFVYEDNGSIWMKQRNEGIWQNLFDFPLVTSSKELPSELEPELDKAHFVSKTYTHLLTHKRISAKFYHINGTPYAGFKNQNVKPYSQLEIKNLAVPRLIELFWQDRFA